VVKLAVINCCRVKVVAAAGHLKSHVVGGGWLEWVVRGFVGGKCVISPQGHQSGRLTLSHLLIH